MEDTSTKTIREFNQELVDIVIARLETLPPNVELSIGDQGSFTVGELLEHIKDGDDIGNIMIEMQLSYINSFKEDFAHRDEVSNYKAEA